MKFYNISENYLKEAIRLNKHIDVILKETTCKSRSTIYRYLRLYNLLEDYKNLNIGTKYNSLTVESYYGQDVRGYRLYLCRCDCGNTKIVARGNLVSNNTKTCGCSFKRKGQNHPCYTGYKSISGKYWKAIQHSAKSRNLDFNLTLEFLWDLYEKQNRKCALSGQLIDFNSGSKKHSASLDRIDSELGYVKDNVQWVHKDVNKIKQDLEQKYFIELCGLITNHQVKNDTTE